MIPMDGLGIIRKSSRDCGTIHLWSGLSSSKGLWRRLVCSGLIRLNWSNWVLTRLERYGILLVQLGWKESVVHSQPHIKTARSRRGGSPLNWPRGFHIAGLCFFCKEVTRVRVPDSPPRFVCLSPFRLCWKVGTSGSNAGVKPPGLGSTPREGGTGT